VEEIYEVIQTACYNMQGGEEKCRCERVQESLAVVEWSDEPCPLLPTRSFRRSREHPYEILEGLACECGKEMGERIFSSDRMVGFWRLHSYRRVCSELSIATQ
jgi:hypothetical protein